MRRDAQTMTMRLVDRGGQLFGRELCVAGNGAFGQDAAGRDQLDAVGASPHLLAHRFARVPRRIHCAADWPTVTAGHAEHRTGSAHPWARDPSLLDRIAHVLRDAVGASDVANRGDPGLDRFAGVLDRAQQPLVTCRRCDHAHHIGLAAAFEMRVRVDQSRSDARRLEIALAARRAKLRDAAFVHDDIDVLLRRLERAVVENSSPDDHRELFASGRDASPLNGS